MVAKKKIKEKTPDKKKGKSRKSKEPHSPLILRYHRLIDAFSKSDDERDFNLDKIEGFIFYVDLDKDESEIDLLSKEMNSHPERYCLIPKLTFYETKKIMEEFVNEKVYDIDTKEKLMDIIQSHEPREHFLEFLYDHHTEVDKWHQYFQERSRIRIIEWLRENKFHFVFEEDLDLPYDTIENLKKNLFSDKVPKDIQNSRKLLESKAKSYYSSEALNPRPKRGRPPKQSVKIEVEQPFSSDYFHAVPPAVQPFLFSPDMSASSITFSAKYETQEELMENLRSQNRKKVESQLETLSKKLAALCEHITVDKKSSSTATPTQTVQAPIIKTTSHKIEKASRASHSRKAIVAKTPKTDVKETQEKKTKSEASIRKKDLLSTPKKTPLEPTKKATPPPKAATLPKKAVTPKKAVAAKKTTTASKKKPTKPPAKKTKKSIVVKKKK